MRQLSQRKSACLFFHGKAADIAIETINEESLLASDIIAHLSAAFTSLK